MVEIMEKEALNKSGKKSYADKLVVAREETLAKQQSAKANTAQSILDKFYETDEEYDERIAKLRAADVIKTSDLKLKSVNIPGYRTHWASTDPKTVPSITELKSRGYRAVKGYDLVPTGHHSVDGAGFHVLMAIPEDMAKRRVEAHQKARDENMMMVKKAKTNINPESDRDFMFEKNEFKKTTIGEVLGKV